MSCRVNHLNKKTGVTNVYESVSIWEKQQSRSKQVCISKIDSSNGEFIPSRRLRIETPVAAVQKTGPSIATATVVGPSLILYALSERLGIARILKSVFPNFHAQILTIAYYLAAHGGPLSQCASWTKTHEHPSGTALEGQRISEILEKISTSGKQASMAAWMEKILEDEFRCYDITSVSPYSELNEYIRFGHNRDRERLPQLNLAMLFGQKSRIPVYYHRTPGNITDVQTVHNLLETFNILEVKVKNLHYVLDRGFYSKNNVDELLERRDHFTISVPLHNRWVREAIDEIFDTVQGPEGSRMVDDEALYVHSRIPGASSAVAATCTCTTTTSSAPRRSIGSIASCWTARKSLNSGRPRPSTRISTTSFSS